MEKHHLSTIDKEVDELTDSACRRQLKDCKHALYFITSRLIRYSQNEEQIVTDPPEMAKKIIQKLNILNEFSREIAELIKLYDCGYVNDILGIVPTEQDNLRGWYQFFSDRNMQNLADRIEDQIK